MKKLISEIILEHVHHKKYQPLKPKALYRSINMPEIRYEEFRDELKHLVRTGKLDLGTKNAIRLPKARAEIIGTFRATRTGGTVRPRPGQGNITADIAIRSHAVSDASTGDVVAVKILRAPRFPGEIPQGRILEVVERAANTFVGTFLEIGRGSHVKIDGGLFRDDIYVGDASAKGVRSGDKVVIEMLRFPSPESTGEGVIVEVLGAAGTPGVDTMSVIRQFNLPDEFSEKAMAEARNQAQLHREQANFEGRIDLTDATIVTIDPPDAKDFDDAISLSQDEKNHWHLGVHIADVSTFVPVGSALDDEARKRGTSVYLPGKVVPMLPEIISNGLASLQEGRNRYAKTVEVEFDPAGRITHVQFHSSVIRVTKRFSYDEVTEFHAAPEKFTESLNPEVHTLLLKMRELAAILRDRRRKRGFLELNLPESKLDYDEAGKIKGAHYEYQDESHRIIEEFMLTANEAVAYKLKLLEVAFPRRVHPMPDPLKLKSFADFVRSLDIKVEDYRSRFELQRIVQETADKPQRQAIHFALLRSMKEAMYSPAEEGHYALASEDYCHFTSPIRRYPDLIVHRMLEQWLKTGKAGAYHQDLVVLCDHCSTTERRAAKAERELVKMRILDYLTHRVGEEIDATITGVEEYGFYAMGTAFPAEGLVHVRTLTEDLFRLDRETHSLVGRHTGKRYRLGDKIRCKILRVDRERRNVDLVIADVKRPKYTKTPKAKFVKTEKKHLRRSKKKRKKK